MIKIALFIITILATSLISYGQNFCDSRISFSGQASSLPLVSTEAYATIFNHVYLSLKNPEVIDGRGQLKLEITDVFSDPSMDPSITLPKIGDTLIYKEALTTGDPRITIYQTEAQYYNRTPGQGGGVGRPGKPHVRIKDPNALARQPGAEWIGRFAYVYQQSHQAQAAVAQASVEHTEFFHIPCTSPLLIKTVDGNKIAEGSVFEHVEGQTESYDYSHIDNLIFNTTPLKTSLSCGFSELSSDLQSTLRSYPKIEFDDVNAYFDEADNMYEGLSHLPKTVNLGFIEAPQYVYNLLKYKNESIQRTEFDSLAEEFSNSPEYQYFYNLNFNKVNMNDGQTWSKDNNLQILFGLTQAKNFYMTLQKDVTKNTYNIQIQGYNFITDLKNLPQNITQNVSYFVDSSKYSNSYTENLDVEIKNDVGYTTSLNKDDIFWKIGYVLSNARIEATPNAAIKKDWQYTFSEDKKYIDFTCKTTVTPR